jgi:CRP-like cAMP-binding protein
VSRTVKNLPSDQRTDWRFNLASTFLRKLSMHAPLTRPECERLLSLPVRSQRLAARTLLAAEGEQRQMACTLLEGHAYRYRTLADGSRQILSFHLPGDVVDLGSTLLGSADYGVATLSPALVGYLPHAAIIAAMAEHPGIARAFWRETFVDASITREWLLNVGRRDAFARLAHLLCETALRSSAAGIGHAGRFAFPVTQTDLGEATALTAVHVNRTLQRLRGDGLVSIQGGRVSIHDWDGLVQAGGFDRTYLHLPATIAA